MQTVDQYEPSGAGSAMSVDPDKVDDMLDPKGNRFAKDEDQVDRSKRLKKKFQTAKGMRAPPKETTKAVGDNTDLTGSGAHSAVNGPYNY